MDRQNKPPHRLKIRRRVSPELAQLLRRRQFAPIFTRMGPVSLAGCSVLLISLMAILYLSQLDQAVSTNQQIQDLRNQQAILQRQNNDLVNTVAQEQSPAYIATRAAAQGLVPANAKDVQGIVIPHIKALPARDQ